MESGAREYAGIEKLLETEPFIICPVHGDSMYPFINEDRDFVRLEKPHGVLAPYDLPLYRRPSGKLVLHRIIEVHRGYYVICGDNRSFRENVPYDWVVAVSTGVIRDGRYIAADSEEYKQYLEENVVGVVPETRRVRRKILNEWYTVLSLCSALLGRGRSKIYEDCYPPRLMQILRKLSLASALAPCFTETVSEKLGREVRSLHDETAALRAEERRILAALAGADISLVSLDLWHADSRLDGVCGGAELGSALVSASDAERAETVMRSLGYECKRARDGGTVCHRTDTNGNAQDRKVPERKVSSGAVSGSYCDAAEAFVIYSDAALPSCFSLSAIIDRARKCGYSRCDLSGVVGRVGSVDADECRDAVDTRCDDGGTECRRIGSDDCSPGGEKLILPQKRDLLELMCAGYVGRYLPIVTSLVAALWRGELSNSSENNETEHMYDTAKKTLESDMFAEPYPDYKALCAAFGYAGIPTSDAPSENEKRIAARMSTPLGRIFPPLSVMQNYYPVLYSAPVLLPACWCWRMLGAAAGRILRRK